MITEQMVTKLLLQACPAAERSWKEHLKDWNGEEAGHYNDIAIFVEFAVDAYAAGKRDELKPLFEVIERMLSEGNEDTRGLASVGFIETLQCNASHRDFGAEVFKHWLGPLSAQAWGQIEALWAGKTSLMDVMRGENNSENGEPSG